MSSRFFGGSNGVNGASLTPRARLRVREVIARGALREAALRMGSRRWEALLQGLRLSRGHCRRSGLRPRADFVGLGIAEGLEKTDERLLEGFGGSA